MWTEIILDKYYLLLETLWILLEYFAWLLFSWHPLPFGLAIICCDGWWGLLLILVICFHHSLGLGSLELRRTLNKLWEDLFFSVKLQLKQNLFPCQFRKPHVQKLYLLPPKIIFHWNSFSVRKSWVGVQLDFDNFPSYCFDVWNTSIISQHGRKGHVMQNYEIFPLPLSTAWTCAGYLIRLDCLKYAFLQIYSWGEQSNNHDSGFRITVKQLSQKKIIFISFQD